jgi:hypothetical protein
MKQFFSIAIAAACALGAGSAAAQPVIATVTPSAARLGETTEITIAGDKLEEPLSVWASFPGQVEIVRELDEAGQPKPNSDPKTLRVRVTTPADAAARIGGIVVGNKAGISEPALLMLDDLPTTAEGGSNHSLKDAQEVAPLIAVDGASDGASFDYFRFAAKAGQRVAIEIVAQRLGSSFDPVMRLLNESGAELLFADDDAALGADCRSSHTFAQDGVYIIELRDVQYRGGLRYRLRVGDFPLVAAAFPLGAPRGAATEFRFSGPDGLAAAPVIVAAPNDWLNRIDLAARLPGGQSSCMTTALASQLANAIEAEPNDPPEAAQLITLPVAVNGRIESPGDRDSFRFFAKKDSRFIFRGLGRTFGSPAYLYLRLFDEKGSQLAEAGAANEMETIAFTTPADGAYRLTVEELLHAGGPGYAYRVEIEPDLPRFAIALKNDKNVPHKFLVHPDGAFALDLQIERQGYDGAIRLALESPRAGFQMRQEAIPAGAKDARLWVLAPSDLKEGELLALRVTGTAAEGAAQASLSTAAILKTKRPELLSIPAWLDGVIHVAVGPPPEPFFALTVKEETVARDATTKEAKFILPLERKNKDYKADPSVYVEGLPAGATAAVKKEGKDAEERFEITVTAAETPAGEHPFQVLALGEFGSRGAKQIVTAKLKVE